MEEIVPTHTLAGYNAAGLPLTDGVNVGLLDAGTCGGQGATSYSGGIVRLYDPDLQLASLAEYSIGRAAGSSLAPCFLRAFTKTGVLHVLEGDQEHLVLELIDRHHSTAYPLQLISGSAAARFGRLAFPDKESLYLYEASGGYADVRHTARELTSFVRSRGTVVEHCAIESLHVDPNGVTLNTAVATVLAQVVVVAAGAWSTDLIPTLNLHARTIPFVRFHSEQVPQMPVLDHKVGTYALPVAANLVQIGSNRRARHIDVRDLSRSTEGVVDDSERLARELARDGWDGLALSCAVGFDAYTDDGRPLIGFVDDDHRIYTATGMCGIGYKLAAGIGDLVSSEVRSTLDQKAFGRPGQLAPFRPLRDSKKSKVEVVEAT
jgi:glycine/D-amino acid oxidase-like deaminating enzyme